MTEPVTPEGKTIRALVKRVEELERLLPQNRPAIICLCGSTRFFQAFQEANFKLTMEGKIVLSVGFYPHSSHVHGEGVGITPEQKEMLDELHMRKIDLADEVFVINVAGYVGESTRKEVAYARKRGKPVKFLEPI